MMNPITVTATETVSPKGYRGIEVTFSAKPGKSALQALKRHGFRWNPAKKVWWSYDRQTARDYCDTRGITIRALSAPRVSVSEVVSEVTEDSSTDRPTVGTTDVPNMRGYAAHSRIGRFLRESYNAGKTDSDILSEILRDADVCIKRGRKSMPLFA